MKLLHAGGIAALVALLVAPETLAQPVKTGAGAYLASPRGSDLPVPRATMRTPAMQGTAAQTNQWYSSLIFDPKPSVLYAQPLTVRAGPAGLEMALPSRLVVPTERRDVEIHYPHQDPLVLSPVAFDPEPARLAKASDWAIDIEMARGADRMLVTVGHGSPYAYFQLSRGDPLLDLRHGGRVQFEHFRWLRFRVHASHSTPGNRGRSRLRPTLPRGSFLTLPTASGESAGAADSPTLL